MRVTGRFEEGWSLLEPFLTDDQVDRLPLTAAARLARAGAVFLNDLARFDEGFRWFERSLRLAEDTGEPRDISGALNGLGIVYLLRGHPRIGQAMFRLAADVARAGQLVLELGMPLVNQLAFGMNRNLETSLAAGQEALKLHEQAGNSNMCWHTAANLTIVLTLAGRWDEAVALRERPLLKERAPAQTAAAFSTFEAAPVATAREEQLDLEALDALAGIGETGQLESVDWLFPVAIRVLLDRFAGDGSALAGSSRRLIDLAVRYIDLDDDFPHLWAWTLTWLIEAGEFDTARELLAPVTAVAPIRLTPLLAAELPWLRGSIEALDPESVADPAGIERDLRDAIAALAAFGAVPFRARAQATLGLWLTRHGRSAEAAPHLSAARETFTELRATAWLRDLDSALSLAATG
jgi:tetratricopeptide (TPR) repeat protein